MIDVSAPIFAPLRRLSDEAGEIVYHQPVLAKQIAVANADASDACGGLRKLAIYSFIVWG